ncbi:MAG: hypothetical protein LBG99_04085 [Propionibacteriaceae bacterium]|nr:hypothetical protein [Propionibacteriaceae bacterium]
MRTKTVATAAKLAVVMAFLALSSCGSSEDTQSVTFTGPWADDFMFYYNDTNSRLGREILKDGIITDMEFQEAMQDIVRCYEQDGFKVTYDNYGYETVESIDGSGDPSEQLNKCAFSDGGVVVLYYKMARNPDNIQNEVLITECLVRVGLEGPGFTVDDFERIMQSDQMPWDLADGRATECFQNPLGH